MDAGKGRRPDGENWILAQGRDLGRLRLLWRTASRPQPLPCSQDCGAGESLSLAHRLPHAHPSSSSLFPFFSPKVKIWFQNKRSKYKKLLKQNSGGQEGDFPGRPPALSPCSPPLPSLWDLPKAGALPTSGYGNNFGAWYQHHSPDVLAPSQMM